MVLQWVGKRESSGSSWLTSSPNQGQESDRNREGASFVGLWLSQVHWWDIKRTEHTQGFWIHCAKFAPKSACFSLCLTQDFGHQIKWNGTIIFQQLVQKEITNKMAKNKGPGLSSSSIIRQMPSLYTHQLNRQLKRSSYCMLEHDLRLITERSFVLKLTKQPRRIKTQKDLLLPKWHRSREVNIFEAEVSKAGALKILCWLIATTVSHR